MTSIVTIYKSNFKNMLVSNLFKGILFQTNGFRGVSTKVASSVAFGNPQMPDKLYKRIELEIKSFEVQVMKSYEKFIHQAAKHFEINIDPTIIKRKPNLERYTILKSVFVHRKHMSQYEIRTYYRWINLNYLTGSTADTFLEYIERMLPEGVALKVTKVSLEPLPSHLSQKGIEESTIVEPNATVS